MLQAIAVSLLLAAQTPELTAEQKAFVEAADVARAARIENLEKFIGNPRSCTITATSVPTSASASASPARSAPGPPASSALPRLERQAILHAITGR